MRFGLARSKGGSCVQIITRSAVFILLMVQGALAQTSWSAYPENFGTLHNHAKLKYRNGAFRMVWQADYPYGTDIYYSDFNRVWDMPVPFSILINDATMGGDAAPGSAKRLAITYATPSGRFQATVQQGETLHIPSSNHTRIGAGQTTNGFVVLSATYGTTTTSADVKSVFKSSAQSLRQTSDLSYNFRFQDFDYDAAGRMFLLSENAEIAYQHATSIYRYSYSPGSLSFSTLEPCVAYGNGTAAIGVSSVYHSFYNPQASIVCSSRQDFGSWSTPFIPAGTDVKQIVFGGGKFIAVGERVELSYPYDPRGTVLSSANGIDWGAIAFTGTPVLNAVCHSETGWVAVGDSGVVMRSSNGYEWQKSGVSGSTERLTSVACANGYCVVGSASGRIWTTRDFNSWNLQVTMPGPVISLAAGDDKFMALGGRTVFQSLFSQVGTVDIVTQPGDRFVVPGQSVLLTVGFEGGGLTAIQWYEGITGDMSKPVQGARGASFQTPVMTQTTSYWVRVSNTWGHEDSQTAKLTVQAVPVITAQPQATVVPMGGSVSVHVAVTGNNIRYQWYEGFSGDVSRPVAGGQSEALRFSAEVPGTNSYWVRAANDLGGLDSISVRVQVTPVAPDITKQPFDSTTRKGGHKSIEVRANGPHLSYFWFAGESGDVSHPVYSGFSSFSPPYNQTGSYLYWVRISNAAGSVDSRSAMFRVLDPGPPVITRQPLDASTYSGTSKSVSVRAEGDSLKYLWYAGEPGSTADIVYDSGSDFTPQFTLPGTYRYWVRIRNDHGSIDSTGFTYTVKTVGTGPITRQPLDTFTVPGASVMLTVSTSLPQPTYQWFRGNSADISSPLAGQTSSSLYVSLPTAGAFPYWVRVVSGETVADSLTATVTVGPPVFAILRQPLDIWAEQGSSTSLSVSAVGSALAYQWYSGESGDISSPVTDGESSSLYPGSKSVGDFRFWVRVISGTSHLDSGSAVFTVKGRSPEIDSQPQDRMIRQGQEFTTSVNVTSFTATSYQWYSGFSGDISSPLAEKTSRALSLSGLEAGNYFYWVRITNPSGFTDSSTAKVTVIPAEYWQWAQMNGLPTDGSGLGAPGASASADGIPNLVRYALGLGLSDGIDSDKMPRYGREAIGGNSYLTVSFSQITGLADADVGAETSTDLKTWGQPAIQFRPLHDNGDGTVTRFFRGAVPTDGIHSQFIRIKAESR